MNCSQCYAQYDEKAQYCAQCGTKTIYNVRSKSDPAITGLWLYVGFLIIQSIAYRILSFVTQKMYEQGTEMVKHVSTLYTLTEVVTTGFELAILSYIIYSVKNSQARIAVVVFTIFTFIMFAWSMVDRIKYMIN